MQTSLNELCVFQQVSASRGDLLGQQAAAPGNSQEMSSFSVLGGTPLLVSECVFAKCPEAGGFSFFLCLSLT